MNSDVAYDKLLPRVRANIKLAYAALSRMTPAQREKALEKAKAQEQSLPVGYQQMARDIIQREVSRGAGPRTLNGAGAASTLANIATIIGTVGTIGLSIYQMSEAKKAQEEEQRRLDRQQRTEAALIQEQIEAMRAQRDAQAQIQQMSTPAPSPAGSTPQVIYQPSPTASGTNQMLLYGGIAAAGLVAVLLLTR